MNTPDLFSPSEGSHSIEEAESLISGSSCFLLKKLARNDCSWADDPGKHQGGPYLPQTVFEGDFFPQLVNTNTEKPHIFETLMEIDWADAGISKSRLVHYSNKGAERHLTRVPKDEFSNLPPASYLLIAKKNNGPSYSALTIDSFSETAEWLENKLELRSDFSCSMFIAADITKRELSQQELLVDEITEAIGKGRLGALVSKYELPSPKDIALEAQRAFLNQNGLDSLSPFQMDNPGDALMTISRDIEFDLFMEAEAKFIAAQISQSLLTAKGIDNQKDAINSLVQLCANNELYRIFLSASQSRKSRAGRSFEIHLATVLEAGSIPFDEQAIIKGRRPDFVLPGLVALKGNKEDVGRALILSAKTTTRERWKQVNLEDYNCPLFLATLDERISVSVLDQMSEMGIVVVIPESLKTSNITDYKKHDATISFRSFFDDVRGRW